MRVVKRICCTGIAVLLLVMLRISKKAYMMNASPVLIKYVHNTGPVNITVLNVSEQLLPLIHPAVTSGGRWAPTLKKSLQTTAIIVPFRERQSQLTIFLNYMHGFLQAQDLDYRIYIIEQNLPSDSFNKAAIMNAGYKEARSDRRWDCYVFHDIDLLPENYRNMYHCRDAPVHFGYHLDKWRYHGKYIALFGGILAFTENQFLQTNGFSNSFWGWGGEDDDMRQRVLSAGITKLYRPNSWVGRITSMKHKQVNRGNHVNKQRTIGHKWRTHGWYKADGLSTLTYTRDSRQNRPMCTWVRVSLDRRVLEHWREVFLRGLVSVHNVFKTYPQWKDFKTIYLR